MERRRADRLVPDLDPENPQQLPDEAIPIFGSDVWDRLTAKERARVRHHFQAGALPVHARRAGRAGRHGEDRPQVPDIDAKFYAATQVIDEARHVEAYARLLHEKFELAYPINPSLKKLLEDTLTDSRWDMTYLGMQVLIEGLALAAFRASATRRRTARRLGERLRHAGRGASRRLRAPGPARLLSASHQKERDEREEFAVDGCYLMRDRFLAEVWETLGLPAKNAARSTQFPAMSDFRARLFTRIVPTINDIGLWGQGAEGLRRHGRDGVRQDRRRRSCWRTTARSPRTSTGRCS